jgi:lipoprotein-anchoring transpeptidase ErfK/SrfK
MAGIDRRRLLFGATLLSAFGLSTVASVADTEIYDAKTRKWVKYDRATARKMFARNGQPPEAFRMQMVKFRTAEKPGTIIIDGNQHFLYLVQPGHQAIRYGIGVGREGFGWAGIVRVGRTAEWPTWTPARSISTRATGTQSTASTARRSHGPLASTSRPAASA